jgi:hypothetical protein
MEGNAGSVRALLISTVVLLSWGAAIYILQLQLSIGPGRQQVINIRWVPGVSESVRRTAEATLQLRGGEAGDPRTWTYSLSDHSREAIRRVVTHPLVEDTNHIDRRRFRILIDAPETPVVFRRILEFDLGSVFALLSAVFGFVVLLLAYRDLKPWIDLLRTFRALELAAAGD